MCVCKYIYFFFFLVRRTVTKGLTGRFLSPSVTNGLVTLQFLDKHSTSDSLTSQVKSGSSELLQGPFRWLHTSSKGHSSAGYYCCKAMFKHVPLKQETSDDF